MKKFLRIIAKALSVVAILLIVIPITLSLVIRINYVQNLIVNGLTSYISKKAGSEISIGHVKISGDFRFTFSDVFVQDPVTRDTMLYSRRVSTKIDPMSLFSGTINIDDVSLAKSKLYLGNDSLGTLNLKLIIDKFRDTNKVSKGNFKMRIDDIAIDTFNFRFRQYAPEEVEDGVNYQNLRLNNISGRVQDLNIINDSISMKLAGLCFTEHCGVRGDGVRIEKFLITPNQMRFEDGYFGLDSSYVDLKLVHLSYRDWDMSDFINAVPLDVDINDSYISMATIAKFTKRVQKWDLGLSFSGTLKGTVSDMKGVVRYADTGNTRIENTSVNIKGLPEIDDTVFDVNAPSIITTIEGVRRIIDDFSSSGMDSLPKIINTSDTLYTRALFKGKIRDFRASLWIYPAKGTSEGSTGISAHVTMPASGGIGLDADMKADNLGLNRLINVEGLGRLTADISVNGSLGSDNSRLTADGSVAGLSYGGYLYHDIALSADYINDVISGDIISGDPNVRFDISGSYDGNGEVPEFRVNAKADNIDFVKIKLNKKDSVSVLRDLRLTADISGNKLDNLNGGMLIDSVKYIGNVDTVRLLNPIRATVRNTANSNQLSLNSDIFDFEFRGVMGYYNLFGYMTESLQKYIPAFRSSKTDDRFAPKKVKEEKRPTFNKENFYMLTLNMKKTSAITNLVVPGLYVADSTRLSLLFNPFDDIISIRLNSPGVAYKNMYFNDINVDCHNEGDALSLYATLASLDANNLYIPNAVIVGNLENDVIDLSARFSNSIDNSEAMIKTSTLMSSTAEGNIFRINLMPSSIRIQDRTWNTNNSYITIEPEKFSFDSLAVFNDNQRLSVNGIIGDSADDKIDVEFDNFNVETAKILFQRFGYDVSGFITGRATGYGLKSKMNQKFDSYVAFNGFVVNGIKLSDAVFNSWWDEVDRSILFRMESGDDPLISGGLTPSTGRYNINVTINGFDPGLVGPFLSGIMKDVGGSADINVSVSNPNGSLSINGDVDIPELKATVDFTNAPYTLSGKVNIKDNQFALTDGKITDSEGGRGTFTASFTNENFKNIQYGFNIDVSEIMALNLAQGENDVFYGKAYATGRVSVSGNRNDVKMNIVAATAKQSTFFLPLSSKVTVSEADYIHFVVKDEETAGSQRALLSSQAKKATNDVKTRFSLSMNLDIRPNLEAEIVVDPSSGSSIKATGEGNLSIAVVPNDNIFTMTGDYVLSQGTYRFILPNFNVLDKFFTIRPGGWIRWSGDPLDARLSVEALYKVKTSLRPLLGDDYPQRANVECVLSLSGQLLNPNIKLGIEVPSAGPDVQARIRSILNTEENVSTQLISLLFTNSFYPVTSGVQSENIAVATGVATGMDFFTNQIKNILDTGSDIDFGLSYRPKDAYNSNELEFNVSAPLWEDRLFLDVGGNYNFQDNMSAVNNNSRVSNLTGDFALTYMVDDRGDIRLTAFSRILDTFDENQGMRENGVGIYYKADFNKFSELMARYRKFWAERPQRRAERKAEREKKRAERQKKEDLAEMITNGEQAEN